MASKVMIIDDSVLVLTVVRHQLEQAGFTVVTRESALGTAAAVLREQPDIVLVDVMMPALGGENLVTLLRKQPANKDLRILLFSDKKPEALAAITQQVGADGYITKGMPPEMLVAQIHACIKSRPALILPSTAAPPELFVLFVDRDPGLRSLCQVAATLPTAGFLHSGHEALALLQQSAPPTCVLAGTHLLDMRGEDLWRAAVAIDCFWRDRIMLMTDTDHQTPAAPSLGPAWIKRPSTAGDLEAMQAAMQRL